MGLEASLGSSLNDLGDKSPLILVGGGGHCRSCIDVIELEGRYAILGIIDAKLKVGSEILGYPILGSDEILPELMAVPSLEVLITVGQIRTVGPRRALWAELKAMDARFAKVISPLAYVSKHAQVGEGSIVMHGAMVNAGARIGAQVILNSKSLVEHDAKVEDLVHISTGAIVNGGVVVESGTFLGSNSTTRQYIRLEGERVLQGGQMISPKDKGIQDLLRR